MDKEMFDEPLTSVQEMDNVVKGQKKTSCSFDFPESRVKEILERLGVTQGKFVLILGVSTRTVENWEQGHRHSTGATRSLLRIVEADPEHALQALRA